ncbi:apoptosis regulator BAX-like [Hippoglossus hippoglossus]|uniref:apoptosis regulator BAX-like n=1 Tax=Hippoglossus hippoglossus TaxID=8267 RepID=UPI00148BECC6|nr:apoptosis regulator BAX-like [Hippoglossus hippoglossus]
MACESNSVSDERIGEALIREVIEEELKHIPSEDVPSFTLPAVELKNEQEDKCLDQLGTLVRKIGDKLKDDVEIQDGIDGLAQGFKWNSFKEMGDKTFEHGITWEKIAILFYIAGKWAVRMVEAHLPQSVVEILKWTVDYFKKYLLGWIRGRGGWICSFSELAVASVQTVSSMSSHRGGLIITFFTGITLGSFISWRLTS